MLPARPRRPCTPTTRSSCAGPSSPPPPPSLPRLLDIVSIVFIRLQTGAGHIGEGSKDLVKGVVGGAASSASKMTDALDNFVRGAGGMDAETPSGMEVAKVSLFRGMGWNSDVVGW